MPSVNKRSAGNSAEELAAAYLQACGCRILDRNWYVRNWGELDIVAELDGEVAFIEVRSLLLGLAQPTEILPAAKLSRLIRLGELWLVRNFPNPYTQAWRVDLVTVRYGHGEPQLEWFKRVA
jgi:putative endonuclease